jgi:hypothetical protein
MVTNKNKQRPTSSASKVLTDKPVTSGWNGKSSIPNPFQVVLSLSLSSKFMQGLPEEDSTVKLGIFCDLKPNALHPLGNFRSHVT